MGLKLVYEADTEPVAVSEAKLHMRVDFTEDDLLISNIIKASSRKCEDYTRRAFMRQTWDYILDEPTMDVIDIPRPPLIQIDGIFLTLQNNSEIELDMDKFILDDISSPARLKVKKSTKFPKYREMGAFRIRFTSGYNYIGATERVPDPIKQAILLLTSHIYENREGQGDFIMLPPLVRVLLDPYRVWKL